MTHLVEDARRAVLGFFHADPDEYTVVFTPNCSGALRLVGEAYPFQQGGRYLLTWDNHNSVNGIREVARRQGAEVTYVPVHKPDMRLDHDEVLQALAGGGSELGLFAFPAQSNFSGVQHPLELVAEAQALGWDVLLDCAAFVPTNRLDLSVVTPDFVPLSFYKMFGYPTGVGALIVRRKALSRLRRPWFAGGTITIASVQGEGWHYLVRGEAGFEDGTVNYLNLPAVEIGLRFMESVGIDLIHERVGMLTGWLLESMLGLFHTNGAPQVEIFGPTSMVDRGGTVAFSFLDPAGKVLDYRHAEVLASGANISLRTGCFCNPGAGEIAHDISRDEIGRCFASREPVTYPQLYAMMQEGGKTASTFRISLGIASNFADVQRFLDFAQGLRDISVEEFARRPFAEMHEALVRDAT
jgi:selenocysteine lyase/cysteine desulfurase